MGDAAVVFSIGQVLVLALPGDANAFRGQEIGRGRVPTPQRRADGSEGRDFAALLRGRSLCSPGREFFWSDGAAIA
jgi:hypothetical protein